MNRAQEKAIRILQIERLLWAHPEGLARAEIARRIGVHRSTITKYLDKDNLPPSIYEDDLDRNLLKLDRMAELTVASFSLHEIMAIHLATRLLATRTDKQNPHAASTLRKLVQALERLDRNVSRHLLVSAEVMEQRAAYRDDVYLSALEKLTEAWAASRKVRVNHQMPDGRIFTYVLSPYFIEPYAVGQTAHVIGWREPPGAVRTLKIERIRGIEITPQPYSIPAEFDPRPLLQDAWGIWYTDEEPVEVVLRFHPRVAARVRESLWHASQRLEEQADGYLMWRGRIAEIREMVPWVRGWGADVEVLAPPEMRDAMEHEALRLAALYRLADLPKPALYQMLWAKADRGTGRTHALFCHMMDVTQVALALWQRVLPVEMRVRLAVALGLETDAAGRLIAFWAGLHDLGKAGPSFQRRLEGAKSGLSAAGLPFPPVYGQTPRRHATVSASALATILREETGLDPRLARKVAQALGGHHGAWPSAADMQAVGVSELGASEWDAVRRDLVRELRNILTPPALPDWNITPLAENSFLVLFSGLVSVADWIGSAEEYFSYTEAPPTPERYAPRAQKQAYSALEELGFTAWQPPGHPATFEQLFPDLVANSMQREVAGLVENLREPALVLIEAPTGCGKTEAALYLADAWASLLHQRGLYVAMPTVTTSNQMYDRVSALLRRRLGEAGAQTLLVHGQARWAGAPPSLTSEDDGGSTRAMAWFLPRKRSLLAPLGVGTVDQSLLGVLQARHFFVRLLGLSHKTVVFDEIHAYDTYMSVLFQRLLSWLSAVGASVVLLSATLPARTRRELVQAYAGKDVQVPVTSYPALTWATSNACGALPLPPPENRMLTIKWIQRSPAAIVEALCSMLQKGGCAAVLCNTVARAQEVYRELTTAKLVTQANLALFHARYPLAWRDEIERRVLGWFCKSGQRPQRAILVATQVVEQSLDLDFDVMVSDLAPVDLLLQRAGRLHRHKRLGRPEPVASPRLFIAVDEGQGVPDFEGDVYVYEEYLLLRTYQALRSRSTLQIPSETAALIESVYGEEPPPASTATLETALAQALERMKRREDKDVFEARKRLVPGPLVEDLLNGIQADLEEDDPMVHEAFRALTRLGPPSVSLVCLHATASGLELEPQGGGPMVSLDVPPDAALTAELARHTVEVSHFPVYSFFRQREVEPSWKDHPLLHDHRAAIFTNGLCSLEETPYTLRLSPELGLEVTKSKEAS